jgi:hypothetical protein
MIAQLQAKFPLDEQTIAQLELERDITAQADEIAPEPYINFYYEDLGDSTEQILRYAFWLASVKENSSKSRYQQIIKEQGWKNEDKKYLKVAETFKNFEPEDLRHIEPDTIFLLAKNNKKYQPVIGQLQHAEAIDQAMVRELIKKQRKPKPFKPEPSIWRATPRGERYCQVPPIWEDDHFTGMTLQAMMENEGLTLQQIIRESVELRLDYVEGRLVRPDKEVIAEPFMDDFLDCGDYEAVDEVQPEIEEEPFMDELEAAEVQENTSTTSGVGFGTKTVDVPRWQLGWSEGAKVVATAGAERFEQWCEGQTVTVVSVSGKVGTIQFVKVARDDGEAFDTFGDWIQEAPSVKVGDKVIWTSCPPQFTSWEPFLVVAIDEDKAKLDIVEKLVPLADLVRV